MDEEEDPPTPIELERKRRGAMRVVRLQRRQQRMRMVPRNRRKNASVAARVMAASASGGGGALVSGGDGTSASEVWVPPSRREAEAGMRRAMELLKYVPEEPIPDGSKLLFPLHDVRRPNNDLVPSEDERMPHRLVMSGSKDLLPSEEEQVPWPRGYDLLPSEDEYEPHE